MSRARNTSRSATLTGGLRVIKDGLGADDKVVINGIARVRPGQKVTPQEEGAPPPDPAKPQANAG